ncbi:deleted in malignant brain tumors 1 protein-like [Oncorhynchus masou masou]|uniref:deleted in malignant brain tumors 1 protein-like n=1 Tax=Oncorhynchus masou masou TaxID=90313 RepID=UPI0031832169
MNLTPKCKWYLAFVIAVSAGGVRLVDGPYNCSGRVEVYYAGQWGTVCDDNWDLLDAKVVCRALGCGAAQKALDQAHFGGGKGEIWLDDVECSGNEESLLSCSSDGLGSHNCGHFEDAGVICEDQSAGLTVRIVDGPNHCSGRVEVYHDGSWGTVCDDNWGFLDAQVVCRELSCGPATEAPHQAYFGEGSGSILLDDVACMGSEGSLLECNSGGIGNHNCGHDEDASVTCMMVVPDDGPLIRLVDGPDQCSGRVEVYYAGQWGTVCDDDWDVSDADVVCRQLSCGWAMDAPGQAWFGMGVGIPILLDNIACVGTEGTLFDCPSEVIGQHNCMHPEDASVVCSGSHQTGPSIRLAGGSNNCSGRVEVFHSGQWGTVCDDDWDLKDAQVVCQALSCGMAQEAPGRSCFGQGSGPITLDDVSCEGTEKSLQDCIGSEPGVHNCDHNEDAGVICADGIFEVRIVNGPNNYSARVKVFHSGKCDSASRVRLVNGTNNCSGRVEVFHFGQWGTVCDDWWDLRDAQVVCRELGCGEAQEAFRSAEFGEGSDSISLDDLACSGSEDSLLQCPHSGLGNHNCVHYEDAGVTCAGPSGGIQPFNSSWTQGSGSGGF